MDSSRRKKPLKKRTVIKIIIVLAVLAAAGFFLVKTLRSRVDEQYAESSEEEVQTAEVTIGSISTTVSGSGVLENEESEDTFISGTVDVTEVYVEAGDTVEAGDMLASVNSASVSKAMKEIQDEIDELDEEIDDLEEESIDETITAGVAGRVKKIYVQADDQVADVMYENKALMLLSVDGYMAADIETEALSEGDSVVVSTKDGTEYEGTVDAVWAGKAVVLIADDEAACDASVTVKKDEKEIGTGSLYIHEQVSVTGFTGTVKSVSVSENSKVSAGSTLLTLEDVSGTINYASLLEQRADLEDELQDLIIIYKEGAVYAKKNGMVTAISETEDSTTTTTTVAAGGMNQGNVMTSVADDSDSEDGTTISICPTDFMTVSLSVDETDILALQLDQKAEVTISSLGDETYSGTVTALDTTGTSTNGVTSYTATITVDRSEDMLNGMSASAVITIEGKDNALLVPTEAVHKTSSSAYVYTSYDEETEEFGDMTEVTTGLSNSNYIEILSGLSEGDTVYYSESEEENEFGFGGMAPGGMDFGGMGNSGGNMPSGGGMPSGNGRQPGGNMPSGGGRNPG